MPLDSLLYDKLTAYCAYSERCISEVKNKCRKLEIPAEEIPAYIARLEEYGFLDEKRYAKLFIRSKISRKWGINKIKATLLTKSVKTAVFQPFLEEISEAELTEKIIAVVAQKRKTIKAGTEQEIQQRLIRYLLGRGYDYGLIKKALSR